LTWDAILFDFDGVLADTEPIHFRCWSEIVEPYGIQLDWDFYQKECVGISDRTFVERIAEQRVPPVPFDDIFSKYPYKKELFRTRITENLPFSDATRALIRELSDQYRLAVVSSSGRTEIEPALEMAGLRPFFHALVCGKEVPNLKPAPDPYLRAAELLGASNPLVVEDSESGVRSGLAAGFEVLRVSSPGTMAEEVRAKLGR
jgi:beta-phosphoglucomutase